MKGINILSMGITRGIRGTASRVGMQSPVGLSGLYTLSAGRNASAFLSMRSMNRNMEVGSDLATIRTFKTSALRLNIQSERAKMSKIEDEITARRLYRNRTAGYYSASLGVLFLALAFCAVPLYRAICQRTGFGGIPITDSTQFTPEKLIPVDTNKRIRIQFTCQSSGILPWKFTPLQREVYVVPGETALAFYKAKNMSKEDIIGMATYSVTPDHVAPYFNKIQCFCFEEQRLSAGEEVEMPVFFFIDPEFAKDPAMRNIDDVVLHYSFFKANYTDGELAAVPLMPVRVSSVEVIGATTEAGTIA